MGEGEGEGGRMRVLSALVLLLSVGTGRGEAIELRFSREDFPGDFIFGSGTSAYQVEGAAAEDGRTPSIWDTFTHAGKAPGEATGDIASDGYHKYKEDVKLMEDTGLEAFRFSISWSRLIPNGRGDVNPKGLQYYNNFIDELISHGIQPHVTLFHYDLPQVLEEEYGGWLSPKIVDDFTAYADVCFKEFGNRVFYWTTLNEPNVFALGGYDNGIFPPQRCSYPFGTDCSEGNSILEPYIVAHNCLLAHASATTLYRSKYQAKKHGFIGLNIFAYWFRPLTNSTEDITATQRAQDFYTGWFIDPLVFGDYPATMKKYAGMKIPSFSHYQTKQVMGSFDFIGLNHYATLFVEDNSNNVSAEKRDFLADMSVNLTMKSDGKPTGTFPVAPDGLHGILEYFKQVYGNPPIYIHENGYPLPHNGSLNDTPRVEYLSSFIGSLLLAIRNGSDTRGYFTWSFLDCFELLDGYQASYGLYYVDFGDKDRTRHPKLSAHWYSNFLKGDSRVVTVNTTSSNFYLQ